MTLANLRFIHFVYILSALSMVGCGESSLNIPRAESELLSRPVFDNGDSDDSLVYTQPPVQGDGDEGQGAMTSMAVNTIGSDDAAEEAGDGIFSSSKITTMLTAEDGRTYTLDKNVRTQLLTKRELLLPKVPDGEYELQVRNSAGKDILLVPDDNHFAIGKVTIQNGKVTEQEATEEDEDETYSSFGVLYGTQDQCQMPVDNGDGILLPSDPLNCTALESPLVIDLRYDEKQSAGIKMSSVKNGVTFDIRGNGKRVQMAWIDEQYTHQYGFLALPEKDGRIEGIHNLFGDNTRGPDGAVADNGFTALAKYDSNGDSYIDKNDAIFDRLRIWTDVTRNGKADAGELQPLSVYGFTQISLNYLNIKQTDRHGNETRMRSAAYLRNGQLRAVFDIWFRVAN